MILESSELALVHAVYFPVMPETWRWEAEGAGGDQNLSVGLSFQGCYLGWSDLGMALATDTATPGD